MSDNTFHFKTVPLLVRGAQILGVTSAAALTGKNGHCFYQMASLTLWQIGYIASFSIAFVPALDTEPPAPSAVVARQWAKGYQIGAGTAPYFAIVSSLSFGFLASHGTLQLRSVPPRIHG
jgi:hypothetical protein